LLFADYKAGKEKALNSLVGAVMKKTKAGQMRGKVREVLAGSLDRRLYTCQLS